MSNMKGKKKPILEVFLILSTVMVIIVGCTPYIADNRNGNGVVFVAPLGSPPADAIAWAPIQDKILVTAGDVGEGRAQVYTIDLKAAKKNILFMTDYGDVVASTWSPDGRRVLILARKQTIGTGAAGLWILDVQNKSLEYLLNSGSAAWSPDGKTIATLSVEDINTASEKIVLSLIDVNTKLVTKIYENVKMRDFFGLAWSPDGESLVFALGNEGPNDLYIINVQSRKVVQLTENIRATRPAWSPVGNVIVYVNWPSEGTRTTLHLIRADGKCDFQISNLEYVASPAWSPDGKEIGYVGPDGIYSLEVEQLAGRDIYSNLCS